MSRQGSLRPIGCGIVVIFLLFGIVTEILKLGTALLGIIAIGIVAMVLMMLVSDILN